MNAKFVDVWPPLQALGQTDAVALENALRGAAHEQVETLLTALASRVPVSPSTPHQAAIVAGQFALAVRRADALEMADALGAQARELFTQITDERAVRWVDVERAALFASRKEHLKEASALLVSLSPRDDEPAFTAALCCVRGSLARSYGDMRSSLSMLEQARELAQASGQVREMIRAYNTLGTSYAVLGAVSLALDSLEKARELAELTGYRQSAAIASGQLASLALDANRPDAAVRYLETQRALSEHLGDVHGLARSLSVLVEAYGLVPEPARAHSCAQASRALYARAPTSWTRLQAVMATVYEAEDALASGDQTRANELLRSCEEQLTSEESTYRIVRARRCFVTLWQALRDRDKDAKTAVEQALSYLRCSPRPTWVERALWLAMRLACERDLPALASQLALRSVAVNEARGAAAARGLVLLRDVSPETAITRAMSRGRDLLFQARLALGPLDPFEAPAVIMETDGTPGSLDRALNAFSNALPTGDAADSLLIALHGPQRALIARIDGGSLKDGLAQAHCAPGVVQGPPSQAFVVVVTNDPSAGLSLSLRNTEDPAGLGGYAATSSFRPRGCACKAAWRLRGRRGEGRAGA